MSSYSFYPPCVNDERSPCPGLNTLANHGYIARNGKSVAFIQLFLAVKTVYNLSIPLSLLLTMVGFITCADFKVSRPYDGKVGWQWPVSWTLDLGNLAKEGVMSLAHGASLVHSSPISRDAPDAKLLWNVLQVAEVEGGLSLHSLAKIHASRIRTLGHKLDGFHAQVAAGEVALAWLVMRNPQTGLIEVDKLESWFKEEKLPRDWWNGRRSPKTILLLQARETADRFQSMAKMV
ncbi:HEME-HALOPEROXIDASE domain-containing protein [Mycena indigotica]|uniref:HEME-HALOPEROXIDASE domain-containing protein n=1 Tax=Mycena indigotica TaxID=2126181 RepID=A0A8H6SE34_9AGAR|nr:HEME-HALOPEROXIDASE domain-containing protein [Mycena indigotica]KAF7297075.1 HEME-HALOPEROXIDASE domain-containing protein [Mycena indigotica]